MKKYVLLAIVVIVVVAGCLGILYTHRNKPPELDTFEHMTLQVIGMRFNETYEILKQETGVTLSRYNNVYENGEKVQKLDKAVTCDPEVMLKLMRECRITAWDGFFGKHPKNVRDGIMFTFEAVINDGQTIYAEGSENFPKGYHEFVQALDQLLSA